MKNYILLGKYKMLKLFLCFIVLNSAKADTIWHANLFEVEWKCTNWLYIKGRSPPIDTCTFSVKNSEPKMHRLSTNEFNKTYYVFDKNVYNINDIDRIRNPWCSLELSFRNQTDSFYSYTHSIYIGDYYPKGRPRLDQYRDISKNIGKSYKLTSFCCGGIHKMEIGKPKEIVFEKTFLNKVHDFILSARSVL